MLLVAILLAPGVPIPIASVQTSLLQRSRICIE
jgi:hypothetical protein